MPQFDKASSVARVARLNVWRTRRLREASPPAALNPVTRLDGIATFSHELRNIGLALVRDLVEDHGGTVQASSAGLGFGSEFTVMVPMLWATRPTHAKGLLTS